MEFLFYSCINFLPWGGRQNQNHLRHLRPHRILICLFIVFVGVLYVKCTFPTLWCSIICITKEKPLIHWSFFSPLSTKVDARSLKFQVSLFGLNIGEAPFWNVLVLYRHWPNSFSPPPPLSNGQTWKKSAPNHPGKPLRPRASMGKKVPQIILTSLYTPYGQCPCGNNTF